MWSDYYILCCEKRVVGKHWFNRNNTYAALLDVMDKYPGDTLNARIEAYVKSTGFSDADIARLREQLLESAAVCVRNNRPCR